MVFILSVHVTLYVSTIRRRCNEFHSRNLYEGMLTIWKTSALIPGVRKTENPEEILHLKICSLRVHHHKEKFPEVVSNVYFSRDYFGRPWWQDKYPDDIRPQNISQTSQPFVLVRFWIGTIPGIGRDENQQVTCDRERESDNVNEWWGSMHDMALLFGTDGDRIL
jgi:hypothetical protein